MTEKFDSIRAEIERLRTPEEKAAANMAKAITELCWAMREAGAAPPTAITVKSRAEFFLALRPIMGDTWADPQGRLPMKFFGIEIQESRISD